jgi:hypothetical protein
MKDDLRRRDVSWAKLPGLQVQPLSRAATAKLAMLLAGLLVIDVTLIALDVMYRREMLTSWRFDVGLEWSYGEWFQYLKTGAIALLMLHLARALRSPATLFWAALFAFLAIDDAFEVHEGVGERLTDRLGLPEIFGLRSVDFGELLYFGAMGVLLLVALLAIARWGRPESRGLAAAFGAGLGLFAFFGVGMDMVHIHGRYHWLEPTLATIEDGGEMIATTLILGIAVAHVAGLRLRLFLPMSNPLPKVGTQPPPS